jgi:acyl carrier protein
LKIDVEKSELSVLNGIDAADWPKIQQVIIEVHDDDGRLAEIMAMLEARGFHVVSDQDESLAATGLYSVYAVRDAQPVGIVREPEYPQWATPDRLVASLREGLARVLPDYMVPSAFELLDAFPLTANGKLDTRALPAFQPARRAVTAPRTELEEQIAAIWRDVLHVTDVGVEDNFFELGGHSLLATRVISRLRDTLAIDLPLRRVFEAPTLESLALAVIEQQAGADADALREALAEVERL